MSRREGRDSHGKRLRSRFDRDRSPSPRRSRDIRPMVERAYSKTVNWEITDQRHQTNHDQKRSRRFQDALPVETSPAPESKAQADLVNKEVEKKADAPSASTKLSSDPTDVPRSRSYFQHDERGITRQGGQSFSRRAIEHRGRWADPKEQPSDKVEEKPAGLDQKEIDENFSDIPRKDQNHAESDNNNIWRHDGYYDSEAAATTTRRRPAFRENKLPTGEHKPSVIDPATKLILDDRPMSDSARREERGYPRGLGSSERMFAGADNRNWKGDASFRRGEMHRAGYQSRERFGTGGGARGRDNRFNGRYQDRNQYQLFGNQVERWKHDLFDEANRSPTPKNEEDQIAKIEALLAL